MKKLNKECENYVRENPDCINDGKIRRARMDYSDNTIIDSSIKCKKKGALDPKQAAYA